MTSVIESKDLVKRFTGVTALDGVDVSVSQDEIVGIIGPNGSGKTTLVNCLTGFLPATAGKVYLDEVDVTRWAPDKICRNGVVRTFQQPMVFQQFSVRRNVEVVVSHHSGGGNMGQRVADLLGLVSLADVAGTQAGALSYGQQRTLGLALAMAASPKIILMDEPTSGLNDEETVHLQGLIRRVKERGVGIGVIDHNIEFILELSDRLIVLDAGRLLTEGNPSEVVRNPEVLSVYLGESFADRE